MLSFFATLFVAVNVCMGAPPSPPRCEDGGWFCDEPKAYCGPGPACMCNWGLQMDAAGKCKQQSGLPYYKYAVCNVSPDPNYTGGKGTLTGRVLFRQRFNPVTSSHVTDVRVDLNGFTAAGDGDHGFHVHQYGDRSNGCASCGGHFNPYKKDHGAPSDTNRHVGDLGNVKASGGSVSTAFTDREISLTGGSDIAGRAIVIHEGTDDLGQGGFPDSKTTGHAGKRMACCTIAISDGSHWQNI